MIAFLAAIIERLVGYPQGLVDRIGHPVMWIGSLIDILDTRLNRPEKPFEIRKIRGTITLTIVIVATLIVALGLSELLDFLPFGWVLEVLIASSLLAQKGLRDAVMTVAEALRSDGLDGARHAVGQIVGRDTADLDEAEISRAAIETLAENASDGVIAPLLYLALFGLPGAAVYKAINTADSMIGHRSERHEAFGWAAAKLDDIVNIIPARLTALLFAVAARFLTGANPNAALHAAQRDAKNHTSPNAGWPEAALAGALDFELGGPRFYRGERVDLPPMGDGRRALGADDIAMAIKLYDRAMLLALGGVAVWALLRWLF